MSVQRAGAYIAAVILGAFLSGCCGGGTTVQTVPATTGGPSVGQQLIELKKAYESGAITEKEYNQLKEDAIEKSKK
jgi:hypothetical protein